METTGNDSPLKPLVLRNQSDLDMYIALAQTCGWKNSITDTFIKSLQMSDIKGLKIPEDVVWRCIHFTESPALSINTVLKKNIIIVQNSAIVRTIETGKNLDLKSGPIFSNRVNDMCHLIDIRNRVLGIINGSRVLRTYRNYYTFLGSKFMVLSLSNFKVLRTIEFEGITISNFAMDNTVTIVAIYGVDKTLTVWSLDEVKQVAKIGNVHDIVSLNFCKDNLVTYDKSRSIRMYSMKRNYALSCTMFSEHIPVIAHLGTKAFIDNEIIDIETKERVIDKNFKDHHLTFGDSDDVIYYIKKAPLTKLSMKRPLADPKEVLYHLRLSTGVIKSVCDIRPQLVSSITMCLERIVYRYIEVNEALKERINTVASD